MGYAVKVLEVDDYICWGTPEDYESFVYWQSFFHKSPDNPYKLEDDITVAKEKVSELAEQYNHFEQEHR
jgi:hypothetical protein